MPCSQLHGHMDQSLETPSRPPWDGHKMVPSPISPSPSSGPKKHGQHPGRSSSMSPGNVSWYNLREVVQKSGRKKEIPEDKSINRSQTQF